MKQIVLSIIALCCAPFAMQAQQPQIYTLKSCLEYGLQNNYSLQIVRNEEQVSRNNATPGNAGYLPTLDFTAGYKGTVDNTNTKVRATGESVKENGVFDQTLNVGLNLNWTIFDGFNITANYQKLKELQLQGETNTRIAIEDLIANLVAEYYNYVQQKIRLQNFRYAVSLSKERLRIVEERYHIGNFSGLSTGKSGLQRRQRQIHEATGIAAYLAHPVKRTDGQRRCGSTARDRRQHYKSECRASIRRVVECYLTDERVTVES